MKKINKRGFLLGEETVKIIIAVICLVILVYFLFSLYQANKNKDLELAKASLEKLITDINSGKTETEIYNPKEWGIVSFSSERRPDFCINKGWEKCLCICAAPKGDINLRWACNLNGVCQENDFHATGDKDWLVPIQLEGIIITPPLSLSINQTTKTIVRKS